jgi:hypothetical protein
LRAQLSWRDLISARNRLHKKNLLLSPCGNADYPR